MARELPSWDWGSLTIQAVADQAGVSRRTVYRHFASESALHAALADRLLEEAGVSYEGLALDDLPEMTGRVFSAVAKFAVQPWAVVPAAFPAIDADRLGGLRSAVDSEAPDWADSDRMMATAALDIVWSVASYEILLRDWNLASRRCDESATLAAQPGHCSAPRRRETATTERSQDTRRVAP